MLTKHRHANQKASRGKKTIARKGIRVAVIGCGNWGPKIIRNINTMEGCEVVTICDADEDRLTLARRDWPDATIATDAQQVCADGSNGAVVVCTPVKTHFDLASMALSAGKHVLVEKPLAASAEAAQQLVDQAERAGRVLHVDHTFVHNCAVREIASIMKQGSLGDLLYFDGVFANLGRFQRDVNVIWDLAPHHVSIMNFLTEKRPSWVSATGCAHYGGLEDIAYVSMGYEDSLLAHIHLSWLSPIKMRSLMISGTKRMIYFDDLATSERVRVYDKGVTLNSAGGAPVEYRNGDMYAPHIVDTEPLADVCAAFIDAILGNPRPDSDGRAGLEVVRILEAAQESIQNQGAPITL